MTDYPNQPTAPTIPSPPKAPVTPPPTLDSAMADGNFFMEWAKPVEKWTEYADYGMLPLLETGQLIIVGAEDVEFTPATGALAIPALQLVSPLGKGVVTTNSFSGTISDGDAVYVKDIEFPITKSSTKSIIVGALDNRSERRTDRIFLGARVGDTLYFRVQMGTSGDVGVSSKTFDAVLAADQSITSLTTLSFFPTAYDSDAYAYDAVNDDVEILLTGKYTVTYNVRAYLTGTVTAGSEFRAYLQKETGGGFVAIAGSYVYGNLDMTYEAGSASMTRIVELDAGDKIRVRAERSEGTMAVSVGTDGTAMTITRVG